MVTDASNSILQFLSVLALSSLRDSRGTLKNDLELLIMSIECLKTVHTLGKETSSEFHPKTDFNSLTGPEVRYFSNILGILIEYSFEPPWSFWRVH